MSERKVTVARSKRPRGDDKSKEFVDLLQLTPTSRWLVIARDLSKKLHNSDESFTPMVYRMKSGVYGVYSHCLMLVGYCKPVQFASKAGSRADDGCRVLLHKQ